MLDREAIKAEIARVLPSAEARLRYEDSLTARPAGPGPDAMDAAISLSRLLDAQPAFSPDKLRYYETTAGAAEFHTIHAWRDLCEIAISKNADEAVNWLEKVATTEVAPLRIISEIFSIKVPAGGLAAGEVTLIPFAELSATPRTDWMKSVYSLPPGSAVPRYPPHVAAVVTVPNARIPTAAEVDATDYKPSFYKNVIDSINDLATALTGVGEGAPVVGRTWTEFADEDLNRAVQGKGFKVGNRDDLGFAETDVNADGVAFALRLLGYEGTFRRKLLIASARLALARRKKPVGDKAIEGSICLEALLGDGQRFDLTYKLGLRAALLTEAAMEARKQVRGTVQSFYRVRSDFVHGSRLHADSDDAQVVRDGLKVCTSVLRKLVEIGPITDWPAVELA